MLSGNGRHRRPRQAPALVVAAGVTGSAIAIPLLGATGASADQGPWDRLVECETGGSWSADGGNGYYGGLQLSDDEWEANGGLDLAPRADMATRAQQILVGQRILASEGPSAWPGCAIGAGLTRDDGGTDDAAGAGVGDTSTVPASPSAKPSASGDSAKKTKSGKADESPEAEKSGKGDKNGKDDEGAGASKSPKKSSKHAKPGASDASSEPDAESSGSPSVKGGGGEASGRHAKKDGHGSTGDPSASYGGADGASGPGDPTTRAAGDAGTQDPAAAGTDRTPAGELHATRGENGQRSANGDTKDKTYKVRSGDNLWAIADAHELPEGWTALYEQNKKVVGADPDLILPGQSLDLGADSGQ